MSEKKCCGKMHDLSENQGIVCGLAPHPDYFMGVYVFTYGVKLKDREGVALFKFCPFCGVELPDPSKKSWGMSC